MIKNRWRRVLVATVLGPAFNRVDRDLREPGEVPTRGIHRVLVCRPNHRLGNMVLLAPLIREVERLYPGAEIDIVGGDAAVSLFSDRFRVSRILSVPRRMVRRPLLTCGLLLRLRRVRYDLAIDACLGPHSGKLLLALSRSRYKVGIPGRSGRPGSAWHGLALPAHHAHRGVFLLRNAYAGVAQDAYPPLDVGLNPGEIADARAVLRALCGLDAPADQVVGIFTNATGAKRFDPTWWAKFVERFRRKCPGVHVVDLVAAHGESQLGDAFTPFYTGSLRNLAAIIANMQGFISGDCGVMHLGAATGTPTLGLFRTTSPAHYGPYGGANTSVAAKDMSAASAAEHAVRWFRDARSSGAATCACQDDPDATGLA